MPIVSPYFFFAGLPIPALFAAASIFAFSVGLANLSKLRADLMWFLSLRGNSRVFGFANVDDGSDARFLVVNLAIMRT